MTSLRFGLPYRTAEKGAKHRLGYAVFDVRDVPRKSVETAAIIRSGHTEFQDAEILFYDGKLWENALLHSSDGSSSFFTGSRSAGQDGENAAVMLSRVKRLPVRTPLDYHRTTWVDLPRDSVDMHEDFIATGAVDAIVNSSHRIIMVDGNIFRVSAGPVYKSPAKGGDFNLREWAPSTRVYGSAMDRFGMDRAILADRIAIEHHGHLLPLSTAWSPPEFRIPVDQLPQWDSLSPAIEDLTAQAMASTNLFQRYYLSRTGARALVDLRSALQSRFDKDVRTDTRGVYALPWAGREPWGCPDASHLIEPLFAFLDCDPEFKKRVALEANMLVLRLKHERHLLNAADFDDVELNEAFKIQG